MMEISTVFVSFHLNQIQNYCPDQENERRDIQLSIEKKITSAKRLQTMLDLKMFPPPLDLTRILKSYHKRNDRKKFPEISEWLIPREISHAG